MARYNVILRSHDLVAHHSRFPRPYGLDKKTLIQICFLSLIEALEAYPFRIQIIGDRLSGETVDFFKRFPVTLTNEDLGPSRAFKMALDVAMQAEDDEWVYLCEDDYLHHPDCFRNVDDLLENRLEYLATRPKPRWRRLRVNALEKKPLFLFLPDDLNRYRSKYRRPSFVFYSRYCHWRQVTTTTFSFMARGAELRRHRRILERCAARLDDGALSRRLYGDLTFWGKGLCLCPIPGLSSHMHDGTIGVLGDWQRLCREVQARLTTQSSS